MNRNLNRRIHPIAEADGLSPKNIVTKSMEAFVYSINNTFGIDPKDLCKTIIDKMNGTDTEKNSSEE